MIKSGNALSVTKKDNVITKKFRSKKQFENELLVYKKRLSYTPKLISHDDKNRVIKISYECCKRLSQLPKKDKVKYYPKLKELYNRFKKDTGYYHNDLANNNVIVNEKTGKIILIDFSNIVKTKSELSKGQLTYLKTIGINF